MLTGRGAFGSCFLTRDYFTPQLPESSLYLGEVYSVSHARHRQREDETLRETALGKLRLGFLHECESIYIVDAYVNLK